MLFNTFWTATATKRSRPSHCQWTEIWLQGVRVLTILWMALAEMTWTQCCRLLQGRTKTIRCAACLDHLFHQLPGWVEFICLEGRSTSVKALHCFTAVHEKHPTSQNFQHHWTNLMTKTAATEALHLKVHIWSTCARKTEKKRGGNFIRVERANTPNFPRAFDPSRVLKWRPARECN